MAKERDPVTGVWNRAAAHQSIGALMESDTPFILLGLALDWLMLYNAQRGCRCGDEVLVKTAMVLGDVGDTLGAEGVEWFRVGEAEFWGVWVAGGLDPAIALGERILAAIATIPLQRIVFGDRTIETLTASMGLVDYPQPQISDRSALGKAVDEALSLAKLRGCNQLAIYTPQGLAEFEAVEHYASLGQVLGQVEQVCGHCPKPLAAQLQSLKTWRLQRLSRRIVQHYGETSSPGLGSTASTARHLFSWSLPALMLRGLIAALRGPVSQPVNQPDRQPKTTAQSLGSITAWVDQELREQGLLNPMPLLLPPSSRSSSPSSSPPQP